VDDRAPLTSGLAPSASILLAARSAQGLAATLAILSVLGLLTTAFPEGRSASVPLG